MTGKCALVTGAARGIGLATTRLFLRDGWQVAMIDRDAPALHAAAADLASVVPIVCDVSQPAQVEAAMADLGARWDRLDALVNNAGVADFGPIEQTGFARWRTVMETNLDGVFLMSQAALPALKAARGAIVNVGSISGVRASTLRVAYGTSKAAVIHLTRQQAAELGEHGVRANCVCPGPVRTKLAMAVHTPAIVAAYHDAIPLNRYGTEDEIAELIVFLCSDKASFITGQVIAADGGFESTGVGLPALRGRVVGEPPAS
ncbi:MAG: SDR family NAD(P)-dependent oxidoreductase [Alphaproteobacteria bacterium]